MVMLPFFNMQAMSPRWYIRNFGDNEASMIHLSYHNGEHYNSVRLKSDPCEGPAGPIIIKADSNLSLLDHNQKAKANGLKGLCRMSLCDTGSVKLVMAGTGCENLSKIEQVLHEVSGDVDAAIEFLIAEQESIENNNSVVSENVGDRHEISCDEQVVTASGMTSETPSQASGDSSTSDEKHESNSQNNRPNEKRIQRNTDCPCGSRRKYKACCGTATRKPSAVMLNKNCGSSNRRKGMKGREPDHIRATSTYGSEVSDLGALCI
ncbi:hypothetical protein HPP92_014355 [Vanilla planifolia]|uniref:Uncharacterized protein n=1 Tax=Vanilla planifolia TaxID=51239 RepID=A0A835UT20_VANPL|nr:hypothetical protein HPP92_014355 [Vanilla planifolia]